MNIAVYRPFLPPWDLTSLKVIARNHLVDVYIGSKTTPQYEAFATEEISNLQNLNVYELPHCSTYRFMSKRLRRLLCATMFPDTHFFPYLSLKILNRHYDVINAVETYYYSSLQSFIAAKASMGRTKVAILNWRNIPEKPKLWHLRRLILRYTDAFIVPSLTAKQSLIFEGTPPSKIHFIPACVDVKRFRPNLPKDLRKNFGLEKYTPTILYIGRFAQEKGLDFLLRAMPFILRKVPDAKLVLVGEGEFKKRMLELVQEFGVEKNVILANAYPYNRVHLVHAIADVFVLPSIPTSWWMEQFGMVLIEAMACGKPIVATNSGAIPEIVVNNETGIIVPPKSSQALAEAIIRLLANSKLAKKMGLKGRERVETIYSDEKIAKQIISLYESLID